MMPKEIERVINTYPGSYETVMTSLLSSDNHLNKKFPSTLLAPYAAMGTVDADTLAP